MSRRRLFEILFIAIAIVLVALIGFLNCLQGTIFVGGLRCNYGYTSGDLIVKMLGTIVFVLFLGLILGPIAATVIQPLRGKRTKPPRTEKMKE
jgi:uncharacterized membrane protein YhaH (DUF805 family)